MKTGYISRFRDKYRKSTVNMPVREQSTTEETYTSADSGRSARGAGVESRVESKETHIYRREFVGRYAKEWIKPNFIRGCPFISFFHYRKRKIRKLLSKGAASLL